MKILFPIGSFYPDQSGGPSNTIYWLNKALIRENHTPIIVTTNKGIPENLSGKWQNTNYGRVIYLKTRYINLPFRVMITSIRELRNCDIVHLTSLFYPLSFIIGFINITFYQKPIVWSIRGELNQTALGYKPFMKRIFLFGIKKIHKQITLHTTSKEETKATQKVFIHPKHIIEIPNFLELPHLIERQNKPPSYLLFIGRLHPIKAIDHLIEALALSKQFLESDLFLRIAGLGDSDYTLKLNKLVQELKLTTKVEFIGQVKDKEKEVLYANALFTFLPSYTENFGNVVVESLAQGTPVVASTGTPWQILEEKHAGFWTENTPSVLASVIDDILALSHHEYALYRKNAYSLAIEDFDVYKNIDKWIEAYKKVLNES